MDKPKKKWYARAFDRITDIIFYTVFLMAMVGGANAFVQMTFDLTKTYLEKQRREQINEMIRDDGLQIKRKNNIVV